MHKYVTPAIVWTAFIALLLAGLNAQPGVGRIDGTVTDAAGAVMPGVVVTVSGAAIRPRTPTSNAKGEFTFQGLPPGSYTVKATHPTLSCNASAGAFGWPQTDGTSKAPVLAGIHTQTIAFFCTPRPADAGTD